LYKRTFKIVQMLALLGKVIIVGRAGALVTRDIPGGLNIRLVAPEVSRVRWMMKKLRQDKQSALTMVRKQDAARRKIIRSFFRQDIEDPLLYNAVWNSDTVNPHEISQSLIQILKRRHSGKARAQ
jgi:cytidylate kinase